jgi:thioredoxin 1
MSDADDIDDIDALRERKKEALREQLADTDSPDEPIHVEDDAHFAEEIDTTGVVLVDFHADWCGPCQMLEPIVDDVAAETAATVLKVDVDAQQGLARQYNVQGVPTLCLFADGEQVEQLVGVQDKDRLVALIEQHR